MNRRLKRGVRHDQAGDSSFSRILAERIYPVPEDRIEVTHEQKRDRNVGKLTRHREGITDANSPSSAASQAS